MEELILLLKNIYPLSPAIEAYLRGIVRRYDFSKRALLLRSGEIAGNILYIRSGLIRSYSKVKHEEVSNYFMQEGDIIISVVSFLRQVPALDNIQALEDCECWGFSHADLEKTYELYPEFNIHGRIITGEYYCRSEERHHSQRRQTPKDKYNYIMSTTPDLVNRVPVKYMASYLGISERTYAYIRSRFSKQKKNKG